MILVKPESEAHAGQALKVACHMFGAPLSHVAKHLGVSRQHAHNMQNTKRMNDERLEKIAEFFGISVEEFLNLSNAPVSSFYKKNMQQVLEAIDHRCNDSRYTELVAHSKLVENLIKELE
jgi:plasmid maintenance system antidote protein VapI